MEEGTARLQINPDALVNSVCVIIAAEDKMRDKPKTAKVRRVDGPTVVPAAWADALKKEKALDKDGKEVPAVVDAPEEEKPPAEVAPAPASGDMTASDLEKGGKKAK